MTTSEEPLDLTAIQARVDAATPEPWSIRESLGWKGRGWGKWSVNSDYSDDESNVSYAINNQNDAEFIAHARADVPALLAALLDEQAKRELAEQAVRAWVYSASEAENDRQESVAERDEAQAKLAQVIEARTEWSPQEIMPSHMQGYEIEQAIGYNEAIKTVTRDLDAILAQPDDEAVDS